MIDYFYDQYLDKYLGKLGGRFVTVKSALMILQQRKPLQPVMLETGCLRADNSWGDGMSTFIFGEYAKHHDTRLNTVDINPDNVEMAKFVCEGLPIDFTVGDSVHYLQAWQGAIDFLYLDSYDYVLDNNHKEAQMSQVHQLAEIEAIWEKLHSKAVILLDDVDFVGGGKSRLSEQFLRRNGAINIFRQQQALWLKS